MAQFYSSDNNGKLDLIETNNSNSNFISDDKDALIRALHSKIMSMIESLLEVPFETIDMNISFVELIDYGFNSLMSVSLISNIENELDLKLEIDLIFEFENTASLAAHLINRFEKECRRYLSETNLNLFENISKKEATIQIIQEKNSVNASDKNNFLRMNHAHKQEGYAKRGSDIRNTSDIAIIGVSCRFAGANNPIEFWNLLHQGNTSIKEIERKHWDFYKHFDSNPKSAGKTISKWGALLTDIDKFDPLFFKISPREAEFMDPQQRLFLEEAYKAIEDSGYAQSYLSRKKTGIFVGARASDYIKLFLDFNDANAQLFLGNDMGILSSRISYYMDLKGPSLTVDTACSSSLLSVHLACESIKRGESDIALSGGVFVMCTPEFYVLASKTNMLSPNGQCKTFDNEANGIVLGEGIGVVVLKRLEEAVHDNDHIYGVIRGSAVNQDGKTQGITVPSASAQVNLISSLYKDSDIDPESIGYIETHGTGTKIGDPIEISALITSFNRFTEKKNFCAIGSHKPNIGHTITSAGIAGLIKVLMAIKNRSIPGNINLNEVNEHISLTDSPFYINKTSKEWAPSEGYLLRAGVSSFGFSGTNVHMVVEEPPKKIQKKECNESAPLNLIVLSAGTEDQLEQKRADLVKYLKSYGSHYSLKDISFTLQVGRNHHKKRLAFLSKDIDDLVNQLSMSNFNNEKQITIKNAGSSKGKSYSSDEMILGGDIKHGFKEDDLKILASSYLKGNNINWEQLYGNHNCGRVSLPAYPFSKNSYWVSSSKTENQEAPMKIKNIISEKSGIALDSLGNSPIILNIETANVVNIKSNEVTEMEVVRQDSRTESKKSNPIAIIGMAGVMPKASNLNIFWQNLIDGKDAITTIPEDRWDWRDYYGNPSQDRSKINSKWGGFIDNVSAFDARFFEISPREAELMDPQHRIFLETTWKAIEDAGYKASDLSGSSTGVFVGVSSFDYQDLFCQSDADNDPYLATGICHSVLSNRVSFLLNLRGPSQSIDTACSSSLVAIHRAVSSINNDECNMAIAGGVNILLSPTFLISFGKAGMLSSVGRCKTFDKDADGYVRSEGAGAILLKTLDAAIRDNDNIYAIIKGTAENHGGLTSSLTVPNPKAQAEVISQAYNKAQIPPNTVSYIELHGTGTAIGDPIEIEGIKMAFNEMFQRWSLSPPKKQTCGIGSAKTNIGHLEAASGIAGLFKTILSMKHKILPKILHFNELNPKIELEGTPFFIVDKTTPWESYYDENNKKVPRRAGISSYGFGGSNSHLVIEEYLEKKNKLNSEDNQSANIIVLSAKNKTRLKEYAFAIITFINKYVLADNDYYNIYNIKNIAYTLQSGREAMKERIAFVANNVNEIIDKLTLYCNGALIIDGFYSGTVNNIKSTKKNLLTETSQSMERLIKMDDFDSVCKFWVSGAVIDWNSLRSKNVSIKRVSLPTYPFAKTCYMLKSKSSSPDNLAKSSIVKKNNPLTQLNLSTSDEIIFLNTFNGDEFFLRDHVINKQKLLPAVAYIEMAVSAANIIDSNSIKSISDVVWTQPIIVNNSKTEIHLNINSKGNYEVHGLGKKGNKTIYSQGRLHTIHSRDSNEGVTICIEEIKNKCKTLTKKDVCYSRFEEMGFSYGDTFRPIQYVLSNDNEALSMLSLPLELVSGNERFELHPTLMDGALQTVLSLYFTNTTVSTATFLPYAIKKINIFKKLTDNCFAYVKHIDSNGSSAVSNYDIYITDNSGTVLISINGFSVKSKPDRKIDIIQNLKSTPQDHANISFFQSEWTKSNHQIAHLQPDNLYDELNESILVISDNKELSTYLKRNILNANIISVTIGESFRRIDDKNYEIDIEDAECFKKIFQEIKCEKSELTKSIIFWSNDFDMYNENSLKDFIDQCFNATFHLSKALLSLKLENKHQLLYICVDNSPYKILQMAISGFGKTLIKEKSNLYFKVVNIRPQAGEPLLFDAGNRELYNILSHEMFHERTSNDIDIFYDGNIRNEKHFIDIDLYNNEKYFKTVELKEDGVYLITGGLGGLGLIFAEHLLKTKKINLILTGRSKIKEETKNVLKGFNRLGSSIHYFQSDISKKSEAINLIKKIKLKYSEVDGVIHSAGIVRDSYILNKSRKEIEDVFSPKIFGTIFLDEILKNERLDFFVLFSSIASVIGNPGQSDYAFANSFMNNFAEIREQFRTAGERSGKTVSICWPLWKNGGMIINDSIKKFLSITTGMEELDDIEGCNIFHHAISQSYISPIVFKGDTNRLKKLIFDYSGQRKCLENNAVLTGKTKENNSSNALLEILQADIVHEISILLKISEEEIDIEEQIDGYGFDSITLTELVNIVNDIYQIELSPTIFIENSSITAFSKYLLLEHKESVSLKYKQILNDKRPENITGQL